MTSLVVCLAATRERVFLDKYFEGDVKTKLISDITFNAKQLSIFRSSMFKAMAIKNGVIYFAERIQVDPGESRLSFSTSENSTIRLEGQGIQAEDPRLFIYLESVYVLFVTTLCSLELQYERGLAITPFDNFQPVCLHFEGMKKGPKVAEKNWGPLVVKDNLYLVYAIDPLIVLHYDFNSNGSCTVHLNELAQSTTGTSEYQFATSGLRIRGGSNYVHYHGQYFIAAGHCFEWIQAQGKDRSIHFSHLIVLDTLNWKVVFISKPIAFEYSHYSNSKLLSLRNSTLPFIRSTAASFIRKWNTVDNVLLDINGWDYCIQDPVSLSKIRDSFFITISVANVCSLLYEIDLGPHVRKMVASNHNNYSSTTNAIIPDSGSHEIGYWNRKVLESVQGLTGDPLFRELYKIQKRIPY